MFAGALSAAAQHIIHAGLNLYTFCKTRRTYTGLEYRWEDWMAVFKESKTIEKIKARKDALAAVAAMDMAERLYTFCQVPEKSQMTTHGMPQQSEQNTGFDG